MMRATLEVSAKLIGGRRAGAETRRELERLSKGYSRPVRVTSLESTPFLIRPPTSSSGLRRSSGKAARRSSAYKLARSRIFRRNASFVALAISDTNGFPA